MARKQQTLRVLFQDGCIRVPAVSDIVSMRHSWVVSLLDFLKEISERHGAERKSVDEGTYWESILGEHESHVMDRWLSWHSQYERVDSMEMLFVIPVDTVEVKS